MAGAKIAFAELGTVQIKPVKPKMGLSWLQIAGKSEGNQFLDYIYDMYTYIYVYIICIHIYIYIYIYVYIYIYIYMYTYVCMYCNII